MNYDSYREDVADGYQPDGVRRERAAQTFWSLLGLLYRRRLLIVGVTGAVAILAVVISLTLDNYYRASARVILPAGSGGGLVSAAILDNLPTAAQSLLGGPSGDYLRYLTVLSSRTMYEAVVDEFDLVTVYDLREAEAPRHKAVKMLRDYTEFVIDSEYEFLEVAVVDADPERAAAMTNFFVEKLTERNAALSSQSASAFRAFVENRYNETVAGLDSAQQALRSLQERYGILDLPKQGEQFFTYLAELRLAAIQAEGEYTSLLAQFGPENSLVRAAAGAAAAANRKYEQALRGREQLLPVPQENLPRVALEYADLERERRVQATLLEYIRPVLEDARFDEEREIEAVQVVDPAIPPVEKAGPRRSLIVIAATLSAFLLVVVFVLLYTWWDRNHAYFAARLRAAAAPKASPASAPAPVEDDASKPYASP